MAKNTEMKSFRLTGSELCFAGQAEKIDHLLLPLDPFQGFLVEDIALELSKAQMHLIERKLIQIDQSGTNKLSSDLSMVVDILGNPDSSFIFQQEMISGESTAVYFHTKGKEWIDLEMVEWDQFQIGLIKNRKALGDRFTALLDLNQGIEGAGLSALIKYDNYIKAREIAREEGEGKSKELLIEQGQDSNVAEKLAVDMANPTTSGSVTEWRWNDKDIEKRNGLAFLGGKERMWLVKENPKKPDWLDLRLSTPKEIKEEMLEFL